MPSGGGKKSKKLFEQAKRVPPGGVHSPVRGEEVMDPADEASVKRIHEQLSATIGKAKVALLHGKMKEEEKIGILEKFRKGEVSVLVATTVVEVGVDVPEANWMVIDHADRLGLLVY